MADDDVNEKYLKKIGRRDWFKNNQAAYFEVAVSFLNAKVKSHYARYFNPTSTNIHLIENACALLQSELIKPEHIEKFETEISQRIESAAKEIEGNIAAGTQLADDNAIKVDVKYFQEPLQLTAKIISPLCYDYLDVLQKADRLIVILESLRLRAAIERKHCEQQIVRVHHILNAIQKAAYQLAIGLRARSKEKTDDQVQPPIAPNEIGEGHTGESATEGSQASSVPPAQARTKKKKGVDPTDLKHVSQGRLERASSVV
jgi:hypothetical protein